MSCGHLTAPLCGCPVAVHAKREQRKPRHKICANEQHTWAPIRGTMDERCTTCSTRFPCRPTCEHYDCREARGEENSYPQAETS